MNLKSKVLIVLLLLVFALNICVVSANDNMDNNTILSNPTDNINLDSNPVVGSSSDESDLSASPGTFSELQRLIDDDVSGVIDLNSNYTYNNATDYGLIHGVTINKELTINGNGNRISGNNIARLFNVTANNVVFNNVILSNGNQYIVSGLDPVTNSGTAIHWTGNNGALVSCTITNNYLNTSGGYAVYYKGDNFKIDRCTVESPTKLSTFSYSGFYIDGNDVTLINSKFNKLIIGFFVNNSNVCYLNNNSFGGDDFTHSIRFNNVLNITINNTNVSSRQYKILIEKGDFVNITNCAFINSNTFSATPITVTAKESYFTDNLVRIGAQSTHSFNAVYFIGGNVYFARNNLTVTGQRNRAFYASNVNDLYFYDNLFSSCSLTAIDYESYLITFNKVSNVDCHDNNITSCRARAMFRLINVGGDIYNNTFSKCYSTDREGGAIFNIVGSPNVVIALNNISLCYSSANELYTLYGSMIYAETVGYIINNTFDGCYYTNTIAGAYGLIYLSSTSSVVENNTFTNNRITGVTAYGVIYNEGSSNKFNNNYFENNNCTGYATGIYNSGNNIEIINNTFISNHADTASGVYNTGNNVNISSNIFNDDSANNIGVIYTSGNNVNVLYNNFTDCYANADVGVIHMEGAANVNNNNFTNCHADGSYGVIFSQNANNSHIYENTYINNTANSEGVVVLGGGVRLNNEEFNDNYVTGGICGVIRINGDNNIVENVNITNTTATSGGAIYNTGNHNSLNNVTIKNTTATDFYGGAIYSSGDYFTIDNLKVYNSTSAQDGGALYLTGVSNTLNHALFYNISSGYDGGAIYWYGSEGTCSDINITNVNATRNGGAINWAGANGELSKVNIINASANGDGGAIYWTGSNGKLSNINLNHTNATNGGAIYWTGTNGAITQGNIENSLSYSDGGAFYWTGPVVSLTHINFTTILSGGSGGAIYGTSSDSTMDDLKFENINSTSNGGAISWSGNRGILSNLIFNNIYSPANGGAIYWTGDKSCITGAKFNNITSGGNGGAIYWTGTESNLTYVNVTNTRASGSGGAVYWTGNKGIANELIISNNNASSGAGLYWSADEAKIYNTILSLNNATNNGGALYLIGESMEIHDLNISKNSANFKGGAIYLIGSEAKLFNLKVTDNNAGADSGAINLDAIDSELYDSVFINNTASANGGAISWLGANANVHNVNFTNNSASSGGAVYWGADNANIYKVNFDNNSANMGGAAYIAGIMGSTITDANFTNNFANDYGGSIYWSSSDGKLDNVIIDKSSAVDGGAIYWTGSNANLSNLKLNNINATDNGGVAYVSGSNVEAFDINITNGHASNGGGFYWAGYNGKLTNVNFKNNNVSNNGGGLYIIGSNFQLINANFTNNNATNFGGGIYWAGSGNINNSELTYNKAYYGSAIYNAGTVIIADSVLLNNKANVSSLSIETVEENVDLVVTSILRGNDNLLNGIWTSSSNIQIQNVTYWGVDGVMQTPEELTRPVNGVSSKTLYFDSRLAGMNITVVIVDKRDGAVRLNTTEVTDIYGSVTSNIVKSSTTFNIDSTHDDDLYYNYINRNLDVTTSGIQPTLDVGLNTTEFMYNTNVTLDLRLITEIDNRVVGLNGTIHVYINDAFFGDFEVVDGEKEISLILPFDVGEYNVTAKYDGGVQAGITIPALNSDVVNFTIVKSVLDLNVTVNSSNIFVDDIISIKVTGPSNYTGSVDYLAGTITGKTYFTDGEFTFEAVYNNDGTVHVLVFAEGDKNYLSSMRNLSFNVSKKDLKMEFVNVTDINVGDLAIITVKLNVSDAKGNVIVNVGGVDYNATISGEYATVDVYNLKNGTYEITANYAGNNKYNSADEITSTFNVKKINTRIAVNTSSPLSVGEDAVIKINLTSADMLYNVNGFVTIIINNNEYNVSVIDGVASLVISGLSKGNYQVNASYSGDDQFNPVSTSSNIIVNKINLTSIDVSVAKSPIYVGEGALFNIILNSGDFKINGSVNAYIANNNYVVPIIDGKGTLLVSGLTDGTYSINVSYAGDDQFEAYNVSDASSVIVNKINVPYPVVNSNPIYVGEDAIIDIKLISESSLYAINGYVTVTINNKQYNVSIINNSGVLKVSGLTEGSYPVDIYYPGDTQFNATTFENTNIVNVNKINILSLNATPASQIICIGDSANIAFNMTSAKSKVNGSITVNVGDKSYIVPIIDGIGSVTIGGLDNGEYSVNVIFNGNEQFNARSFSKIANITVNKFNITSIKVTSNSPIYVGENAVFKINVTTSDRLVNGTVILSVNNRNYSVAIIDGVGSVSVNGLDYGNYSVNVSFVANDQYNSLTSADVCSVLVDRINISSITVTTNSPIYVGQNAIFNIMVTADKYNVNGYATVKIGNKNYTVAIIEGKGLLNITGLNNGTYDVSVAYNGDNIFNPKTRENIKFTVNKVDIRTITVKADSPIYAGQNSTVNISVVPQSSEYAVNGVVTVKVDGKEYNISVVNGNGTFTVNGLSSGSHPIDVYYAGNYMFNSKNLTNTANIVVNKVNIKNIILSVDPLVYVGQNPTINISMISQLDDYIVNGFVTVTVNNEKYNVSIINGNGSFSIQGLGNGTFPIKVNYKGDNIFNPISNDSSVTVVNKIATSIHMNDVSIKVGDIAVISARINNAEVTGNVTFTVDNKDYVTGIVNGVASINITGLNTSSDRNIKATYLGDYKYLNSTTTSRLYVTRVDGNASITTYDITAGETETVIINLPSDISNATIRVELNGNEVVYNKANNVISFNRSIQESGIYTVMISVRDDCKYNDFTNSSTFEVFKVSADNYTVIINMNNTRVFEEIPIIVNLPNDANGTVEILVDGEFAGNANVNNGIATYTLNNLSYGNHSISVNYSNDKYDDKITSKTVFVNKLPSNISINVPVNPKVAHDIIVIVIPENSTGNITASINGKEYEVINRSIINASDLLEGSYTVIVELDTDDNYYSSSATGVFTVTRNNVTSNLTEITSDMNVGAPVTIHVDFDEEISGDVIFSINGLNYTVNVDNSKFAEYNWTPQEGNIIVKTYYMGNDTYYPSESNTIEFNVFKNPISFNTINVTDIKVGDTAVIAVSLNESDATGIISIELNKTTYESVINDGTVIFNIHDLNAGTYEVIAHYGGDAKYLASTSKTALFNVTKYNSAVNIDADDIMVGDDALIIVSVPNATGHVYITVNNESVYKPLVNSTATWNIPNLSYGEYNVEVSYNGDYKYLANKSSKTFEIHKYNATVNIEASDIWTHEDEIIEIILPEDATGNITITLNNESYTSQIDKGIVKFNISDLNEGNYTVNATYSGDNKYNTQNNSTTFTVKLNYPIINADNLIKYYRANDRLYINLTNARGDRIANETITITINGIEYTRTTNSEGSLSLAINLPSGEFEALINYNGSEIYEPTSKTVNVTVLSTINSNDLTKVFCNDSQFLARFTDSNGNPLANTAVQFNINGVFYNRMTDENGWAKLNINLPQGEYIITSYNLVTGETAGNLVTVLSRIVENNNITKTYLDPTKFTVRIVGDDGEFVGAGESVEFNINGVFYTRTTNADGYAALNINLPEGKYIITSYYRGCKVANTVTVLPKN